MMEDSPTDHELNAVLARVAGVEVIEQATGPTNISWYYWVVDDEDEWPEGEWHKWCPLHDANQMEMVKAKLREIPGMQYGSDYCNNEDGQHHTGFIYHRRGAGFDPPILYRTAEDPNELRAFALAVYAMEQERMVHGKDV